MKKFIWKFTALFGVIILGWMCKDNNDIPPKLQDTNNYPGPILVTDDYPTAKEITSALDTIKLSQTTIDSVRNNSSISETSIEQSLVPPLTTIPSSFTLEEYYSLLDSNLQDDSPSAGGVGGGTPEIRNVLPEGFGSLHTIGEVNVPLTGISYNFIVKSSNQQSFPQAGKLYALCVHDLSGKSAATLQYIEKEINDFSVTNIEKSSAHPTKLIFFTKKRIGDMQPDYSYTGVLNKNIVIHIENIDKTPGCKVKIFLTEYSTQFSNEYWVPMNYHAHYNQKLHTPTSRRWKICGLVNILYAYRNTYGYSVNVNTETIENLHQDFLQYGSYTKENYVSTQSAYSFVTQKGLLGKFLGSSLKSTNYSENSSTYRENFKLWLKDELTLKRAIMIPLLTNRGSKPFTGENAKVSHFVSVYALLSTPNGSGSVILFKNSLDDQNTQIDHYTNVLNSNYNNQITTINGIVKGRYGAVSIGKPGFNYPFLISRRGIFMNGKTGLNK